MAEPLTIARPYAEAIFRLACDRRDLAGWSSMLTVLEALVSDPQIQSRIGNPNVSGQQLEGVADDAQGVAPLMPKHG